MPISGNHMGTVGNWIYAPPSTPPMVMSDWLSGKKGGKRLYGTCVWPSVLHRVQKRVIFEYHDPRRYYDILTVCNKISNNHFNGQSVYHSEPCAKLWVYTIAKSPTMAITFWGQSEIRMREGPFLQFSLPTDWGMEWRGKDDGVGNCESLRSVKSKRKAEMIYSWHPCLCFLPWPCSGYHCDFLVILTFCI